MTAEALRIGMSRGRLRRANQSDSKEAKVYAVVVKVRINDREAAQEGLDQNVVPQVSQAPGFKTGYWTWKDNTGLSMVVMESEEAANQAANRVREMVGSMNDAVSLEDVEVREVVAHA